MISAEMKDYNLNLSGFNISSSLNIRSDLVFLTINHSNLQEIPSYFAFKSLKKLDLSFNTISMLPAEFRCNFPALTGLVMPFNCISFISGTTNIFGMNTLSFLDLSFNPVSELVGFKHCIAEKMPYLSILNGSQLIDNIEEETKLIPRNVSVQHDLFRPLSIRTSFGPDSSSIVQTYIRPISVPPSLTSNIISPTITTLELDSCSLTDLDRLPLNMPHLKWASFNKNHLETVSKLASYSSLIELSISHNQLECIGYLSALPLLEKLDASHNRLTKVEKVEFKKLTTLFLQTNQINDLLVISKIASLRELCKFYC